MLNIISLLDDELFHSKKGKSKFDYWIMLCEIITKQTDKVKEIQTLSELNDAKIKQLLTQSQKEKYKAMQEDAKNPKKKNTQN
jgi:hypothetical protein